MGRNVATRVSLFKKLIRWSRIPREEKNRFLKELYYTYVSPPFIRMNSLACRSHNSFFRRCYFDAVRRSDKRFLIAECKTESLIVNCKDTMISRYLYVSNDSDIWKFLIAFDLLKREKLIADKIKLLVDVGANIGSICIPAVTRGYVDHAIAIEPHPMNCNMLRANTFLNFLQSNIDVYETAVGPAEDETVELELSEDNWGDHRIAVSKENGRFEEAGRKKITVGSTTLDKILGTDRVKNTFIWMDIQGFEGLALKGATKILEQRPPLAIEFWPYGMERAKSYQALKNAIAPYSVFYDLGSSLKPSPISSLDDLYSRFIETGEFSDILLV